MADEKKPKIDLKARLGKTAGPAVPGPGSNPPGPGMAQQQVPPPVSSPSPSGSPPPASMGMPPLPGVPVGPPPSSGYGAPQGGGMDPSNPLLAAAGRAPMQQGSLGQPQRIEVDELAVEEARKGARKQGFIIAGIAGILFLGVGFVAGKSAEVADARSLSVAGARDLEKDVAKAKDQMNAFADKAEAAAKSIMVEKKFPDAFMKELGGINVDFDGQKIAGRRFSGFSADTVQGLFEMITGVQALNDRKAAVQRLLSSLQKPLTEKFAAAAKAPPYTLVAVVDKDSQGNLFGTLSPLAAPLAADAPLPKDFTVAGNKTVPRYVGGDLGRAIQGIGIAPKSFGAVCTSESATQEGQLVFALSGIVKDIRGDKPAGAGELVDTKPGLAEKADKVMLGLQKVK